MKLRRKPEKLAEITVTNLLLQLLQSLTQYKPLLYTSESPIYTSLYSLTY